MEKYFDTEDQFIAFLNSPYQMDRCGKCQGLVEVSIEPVYLSVDGRILDFEDLPLLKCTACGRLYLTDYAKDVLGGCYSDLLHTEVDFSVHRDGRKKGKQMATKLARIAELWRKSVRRGQ